METTHVICHYNEITLKGRNRPVFEKQLANNISSLFKKYPFLGVSHVARVHGRIIITLAKEAQLKEILRLVKKVPGIAKFSPAYKTERDIERIKETALSLLQEHAFTSFKVQTKRSDKQFPLPSPEINRVVGHEIGEKLQKKVDLTSPDIVCTIEITQRDAFIYFERIKGMGGLPVGSSGKACLLISGGIDSPVAGSFAFKRGVCLSAIHFHATPYTSPASIDKVKRLISTLTVYQSPITLYLVPLANIQRSIAFSCPEKLRIVLYRRFMLRLAEKIAEQEHAEILITGEVLNQVASQTTYNMRAIQEAIRIPVVQPLAGLDKEEIIEYAKNIGTFDISIEPHEDCCTQFTPAAPETKAKIHFVKQAEKNLDIDQLVSDALTHMEVVHIHHAEDQNQKESTTPVQQRHFV